ncbi:cytochrome c biogenesis protein CcdA [Patescibacteria group bacterium AH-259-L07]|nr:cytochrome c biogenesis protein CcdA [Patescibacteria group bacterium AH-259-L07]
MNEVVALIIPAFIAGIITFLAPCTLPLVPAYLGFISGASAKELKGSTKKKGARRKIFLNGLFFMIGVTVIFVLFGTLAGLIGQALTPYRIWLTRIGGVFVILFGLLMVGIVKIPFFTSLVSSGRRMKLPFRIRRGNPLSSALLGGAFATGWTPCVGPILAAILVLASTSTTAFQGGFLLFVFSMGLAIPFLIVAASFGTILSSIAKITKYLHWVEVIGGIFLILLGILLLTNNMVLLISWGFRLFQFINYERLLNFL